MDKSQPEITEEYYVKNIEKCDAKKAMSLLMIIFLSLPFIASSIVNSLNIDFANMIGAEGAKSSMENIMREINNSIGLNNFINGTNLGSGLGIMLSGSVFALNSRKKKNYAEELLSMQGTEIDKESEYKR